MFWSHCLVDRTKNICLMVFNLHLIKFYLLTKDSLTTLLPFHPFAYPYPNALNFAFGGQIGLFQIDVLLRSKFLV
jgi:hypothetical protein